MDIVVLKFGGSSVANNEKLELVSRKIISYVDNGNKVVVVVSAQGKTTDLLINEASSLSVNPCSRELDVLLSTGEQVTIAKLSILLNSINYPAVSLTGWQAGIYTNNVNQDAIIEHINTKRILSELDNNKIVIVAGFQGINESNDITTLGRGGSDTSAISIAAALNAKSCYIYSDVEGIFTGDPNKIKSASKLENLSYDEMLDISNEGAKVLHNRCVEIGKKFNIPIIAKSTFNDDKGTIVNNEIEVQQVKSIVKNDELMYIYVSSSDNNKFDLYQFFISNGIIPIEFLFDNSITEAVKILIKSSDFKKIDCNIQNTYVVRIEKVSRISIVGFGISNNTCIINKLTNTLSEYASTISKIDVNNGKIRIMFKYVVDNTVLERIHSALFG